MKRLTKSLSLFLLLAMIFSLTACVKTPPVDEGPEAVETDVLIIGAGGAGLTAAFFARDAGKDVILLEKRAFTGGNSILAGKFDAGGSKVHDELGVDYSAEDHYNDTFEEVGQATEAADPDFVRNFTSKGGAIIDWLKDVIGAPIGRIVNGKEIYAPLETGEKLTAEAIVMLTEKVKEIGVDLRLETAGTKLLAEEGKVVGAEVKGPEGEYTIKAKAVIIASGGFAASDSLVSKYAPEWGGTPTSNTDETTGDGIIMAEEIGAALSNMDSFTLNPTFYTEPNGNTMSASGIRYSGGILVDKTHGKRFAEEMEDYTAASLAELALPEKTAFGILDANSVGRFINYPDVESGDTPEELAEKIGVDPQGLAETIANYIKYYDNGYDEDFGRTDMRSRLDTAPYYAVPVFPGVHNTHGGIAVDLKAQVLDTSNQPIPGLYAAGDVADHKLFGAEALTAAYVYGKIAAESAIDYLD